MRSIAVVNQKGGVGKTTTVVNLASALGMAEKKVLVVDLDPQANATSGLGIAAERIHKTIYDVFLERTLSDEAIIPTKEPYVDCVASEPDLFGIDVELSQMKDREFVLKEALKSCAHYDYVLIDCPPSLSLLTVNAITAAFGVLIPVQAQYYALEGLSQLLKSIELFRKGLNVDLQVVGLLLTMYEPDNPLCQSVLNDLRVHFPADLFRSRIDKDSGLSEAPSFGQPMTVYDLRSPGAENYLELAQEFLERMEALTLYNDDEEEEVEEDILQNNLEGR